MPKILITPALPYVNNIPHLGNIIGSVLIGDILARKYRKDPNNQVLFVCGKDEYGTQTMVKAMEENLSCYEICNKYGELHDKVYQWFNIKFDYFGRTSTSNPKEDLNWTHTKITQDIFSKIHNNGYLSLKSSQQLFCEELNMFMADRFITGTCYICGYDKASGDQCDGCCNLMDVTKIIKPICKIKDKTYNCFLKETTHFYLELPKLKEKLEEWFQQQSNNWSKNVPGVTNSWLSNLKERCITRDISWGTPLPESHDNDNDNAMKNKKFYNWFDASIGYISCVANYLQAQNSDMTVNDWFNSNDPITTIHAFSKDNIFFHTIMFPATLLATQENYNITSPNSTYKIASCEYLNYLTDAGKVEKFSKSRGIGLFGDQVIKISEKLGITSDYWRYYLVKIRPETSDSVFNLAEFVDICNTDLCCKYGNLINRIRKFDEILSNKINTHSYILPDNNICFSEILKLECEYNNNMESLQLRAAQANVMSMVNCANQYISSKEPWKINLNHSSKNVLEFSEILRNIIWMLIIINECFEPFIPNKANLISSIYDIKNNIVTLSFDKLIGLPFNKLVLANIKKEIALL